MAQVNARKVYDEPDVLAGMLDNRLFLGILGSELLLQARSRAPPDLTCSWDVQCVLVLAPDSACLDRAACSWRGHSVSVCSAPLKACGTCLIGQ